jgi:hypothetical protein
MIPVFETGAFSRSATSPGGRKTLSDPTLTVKSREFSADWRVPPKPDCQMIFKT